MKYTNFIKKYIGQKIDFDNSYGCQCVDLIDQYINDVPQLKKGFWGNARDWWLKRNNNKWLKENFEFINPFNKDIKTGDIGVRATGTYGHIFLIDTYNPATNELTIYDTNGKGQNDAMTKRVYTLNAQHITGILRPRNNTNIDKSVNTIFIDSPCTIFKTNAYITKDSIVYADNKHNDKIGKVFKNEKVKILSKGKDNTIIQYGVDKSIYKVGIVATSNIKEL